MTRADPLPEFFPPDLVAAVDSFARSRVLVIGDVMLDEYLNGDAERISPEAPVPVVTVEERRHLLGGAGNVARNIVALGGEAHLIGVRGRDASGEELERCLSREGIQFSLLCPRSRPTTVKTRVFARQQQVLRIDREETRPLSKAQLEELLRITSDCLPGIGAIVVSDYGKGIVCSAFMRGLRSLATGNGRNIPILVDPKPQNFSLYKGVTLLTPNSKETSESVNMPVATPAQIVRAGKMIMRRLGCRELVSTLGPLGMAVFEQSGRVCHIPTTARQVFDVTGAGDTVIGTLALGSAAGVPLIGACLLANYAAGMVIAQVGAATVSPSQLAEAVATLARPALDDWSAL